MEEKLESEVLLDVNGTKAQLCLHRRSTSTNDIKVSGVARRRKERCE
jgi:hypothetical protein